MDPEKLIISMQVAFDMLFDLSNDTGPLTAEEATEIRRQMKARFDANMAKYRVQCHTQEVVWRDF